MSFYVGYKGATSTCSGKPQPGCVALMSWFLGAYGSRGARNDGIYNCRSIRGASIPSVHGEGRAADLGCSAGDQWAQDLANLLVSKSLELGIQCVIFNRKIWSGAYPTSGWRDYHGVDAHTTHLHVELSWPAATSLTVDKIKAVLTPVKKPYVRMYLSRVLQLGSSGLAVTNLQKEINRRVGRTVLTVDGDFGPKTESWVKYFQNYHHLYPDGVVGPKTTAALGWVWKG